MEINNSPGVPYSLNDILEWFIQPVKGVRFKSLATVYSLQMEKNERLSE